MCIYPSNHLSHPSVLLKMSLTQPSYLRYESKIKHNYQSNVYATQKRIIAETLEAQNKKRKLYFSDLLVKC